MSNIKYIARINELTGTILNVEFPGSTLPEEGLFNGIRTIYLTDSILHKNFMKKDFKLTEYMWNGSEFVHIGKAPNRHAFYNGTEWEWDQSKLVDDIRKARNRLLAECDWTQLADSSLDDATKAKWVAYRTELKDVPSSLTGNETSTKDVDWPEAP